MCVAVLPIYCDPPFPTMWHHLAWSLSLPPTHRNKDHASSTHHRQHLRKCFPSLQSQIKKMLQKYNLTTKRKFLHPYYAISCKHYILYIYIYICIVCMLYYTSYLPPLPSLHVSTLISDCNVGATKSSYKSFFHCLFFANWVYF